MKFSLLALAATLAVVNAADCDTSKLMPLLSDPNVAPCTADSGFSVAALSAPTGETLTKLCASTACKKLLSTVTSLGLGDCTLGNMKLETDLVTPITTACASGSSSTAAAAGSSAGSKASSATVTTPAPAATTAAPKSTKSGSTSGSSASSTTIKTPSATSTPAPSATKSAASAVTVAASAAVVAVAAAFM